MKRKVDPDIVLVAPSTLNYVDATLPDIYKELASGRRLKYYYRNDKVKKEDVKKMIMERQFQFKAEQIRYTDVDRFYRIPHGGLEKRK